MHSYAFYSTYKHAHTPHYKHSQIYTIYTHIQLYFTTALLNVLTKTVVPRSSLLLGTTVLVKKA